LRVLAVEADGSDVTAGLLRPGAPPLGRPNLRRWSIEAETAPVA